jgi:hypothetical protein
MHQVRIEAMMRREELECVLDQFPKYQMKLLLRDLIENAGREDILKPTVGNLSVHEISNDNGVSTSETLIFLDIPTVF